MIWSLNLYYKTRVKVKPKARLNLYYNEVL